MKIFPRPTWLHLVLGLCAFWLVGCAFPPTPPPSPADSFRLMLAPQTLRADEATVIWNKPAGTRPDSAYEVLLDGAPVGVTTKTHFTLAGLAPERDYHVLVRAHAPSASASSQPSPSSAFKFQPSALLLRTPSREPVVSVLDHGAVGDGRTLNTRAIQTAIDSCPRGGVVRIPEGVFLSGALFLKSDMTLEIAEGGVLKGSSLPEHYAPFVRNRFEGWEMDTYSSLLNAGTLDSAGPANIRNLAIRGRGKISGGGRALSDAIRAEFPGDKGLRSRGRLILFMNAENVEVSGLTLEETPCWTLHYIYSRNVSLHGLTIRSDVRNGDGIDPDSSLNSYIFNCTFDTGDDCIAIKSGKNPEGNVIARPTVGVRIFDCRFERGHGISIGSEMSGGVRDVLVEDCVAGNLLHGLQIKGTPERGGFVENVTVRDCDLRQITIHTKVPYNNDGAAAPAQPYFRDFRFENIDLSKADPAKPAIIVNGFEAEGHRTRNLAFSGLRLSARAKVAIDLAQDVTFTDITSADGAAPAYTITRSERISP